VTASPHPPDCDAARLRASVAIDGELDDVNRVRLDRHLSACAECARVAARMEEVAALLRGAPHERFRCEPGRLRRLRSTSPSVRQWAGAVVAVAAVVLVTGALPDRGAAPQRDESRTATAGGYARVSPLELPIGQRSAMDDFVAPPLHARG
jgi:predicted anti-sigma-YlaC factor YlaD